MSSFEQRFAHWKAKIHDQDTFAALDKEIQAWTQQINYLQSLAEGAKKKKIAIDICYLNCLEPSMDVEVTPGIEWASNAWNLEKELENMKAQDLQIDQRLDHVQIRFDGMKWELGL